MKAPPWSPAELDVLRSVYADRGLAAAAEALPDRSRGSIYVKANNLGILTSHRPCPEGKFRKLAGPAARLRAEGWSYAAIGVELGVSEATATNACLLAEGQVKGHRPIERDANGKFAPEGIERLRLMLRKGMKHRDIQVILGISGGSVTRERRAYEKHLRANHLAPLPPPGGGERYSGVAVAKDVRREVERLYLEGWGAGKISEQTGVSRTHVLRTRTKLIKRLKRKGECLPGCDISGRRIAIKGHGRAIPNENLAKFRSLLMQGEPVRRAAREAVIGGSSAYRIFHELEDELAARGEELPRKPWRGKVRQRLARCEPTLLPGKRWGFDRYRALVHDGSSHEDAVKAVRLEWAAKLAEMPFEERTRHQLAAGGTISATFRPVRHMAEQTLGGVASGALS